MPEANLQEGIGTALPFQLAFMIQLVEPSATSMPQLSRSAVPAACPGLDRGKRLSATCGMILGESNHECALTGGEIGDLTRVSRGSTDNPVQTALPALFRSFFLGGFECSSHRRRDGRRLDLIAATRHDLLSLEDYEQLRQCGILTARDGVRWHQVEAVPGCYDWSLLLPMLRAAENARIQVVWDLCHYGWPDHLDVFSAAFVEHFARYAAAFARLHLGETGRPPLVCPSPISPGRAARWRA